MLSHNVSNANAWLDFSDDIFYYKCINCSKKANNALIIKGRYYCDKCFIKHQRKEKLIKINENS